MPSIKVMSWNIENLGQSKFRASGSNVVEAQPADRSYAAEYISEVIDAYHVDVMGVMELRGAMGNDIADLVRVNADEDFNSSVSSQQQSQRQEEAIYFWRESADFETWRPAPNDYTPVTSSVNTIDDDSLEPLTATLNPTKIRMDQVYTALSANNYITRDYTVKQGPAYRVNPKKWSDLKNGGNVVFASGTDPGFTADQKAIIKSILLSTGIVLFPNKDERSPYLKYFSLGPTNKKIVFSVLHFPGPDKAELKPAIANLTLCDPLINTDTVLIMGDFNITREAQANNRTYWTYTVKKKPGTQEWAFLQNGVTSKKDFFSVLKDAPIGATDLMGNLVNTSLQPKRFAAIGRDDYRVNPYDKFFFKTTNNAVTHDNSAHCVDLITAMDYSASLITPGTLLYKSTVALAGMRFLKARYAKSTVQNVLDFTKVLVKRKREEHADLAVKKRALEAKSSVKGNTKVQAKRITNVASQIKFTDAEIKKMDDDLAELKEVVDQLEAVTNTVPATTPAAFIVYRSISDHLPISVTLTF